MANILWVEDFEGSNLSNTTEELFDGLLPIDDTLRLVKSKQELRGYLEKRHVTLRTEFWSAWCFIDDNSLLEDIDIIVLDIDLVVSPQGFPLSEDQDEQLFYCLQGLGFLEEIDFNAWEETDHPTVVKDKLKVKELAGYLLFLKLTQELGFPKENVVLYSNHSDNLKTTLKQFDDARIPRPNIYEKTLLENDKWKKGKDVRVLLKEWINDPYMVLRRGILNGVKEIRRMNTSVFINQYIEDKSQHLSPNEVKGYLDTLAILFPLDIKRGEKKKRYKIFTRMLFHEWDRLDWDMINNHVPNDRSAGLARTTRNFVAHLDFYSDLTEENVAFFFLFAMRALFDLGVETRDFEEKLFSLFAHQSSGVKTGRNEISVEEWTLEMMGYGINDPSQCGNSRWNNRFRMALKELSNPEGFCDKEVDHEFLLLCLYRAWLVAIFPTDIEKLDFSSLSCKNDFFMSFAHHILNSLSKKKANA